MPSMSMTRALAVAACCGAVALAAIAGSACAPAGGHTCADVGCDDGANIDLESPTGAWMAGTYELDLVVDGNFASCALRVPRAPSATTAIDAACTSSIGLSFLSETQCQPLATDGAAVGSACSPVPGAFHQVLSLPGMPAQVALLLRRDGHVLLASTTNLTYQDFQPNGPECAPTCRQAGATLTIGTEESVDGGADAGWPADAGEDSVHD